MRRAFAGSGVIAVLIATGGAHADEALFRSLPRVERQYQQRLEMVQSGALVPSFQGSASIAQARAAAFAASIGLAGVPQGRGHFCGGVVVNPHWILTAAHCLSDVNSTGNSRSAPLPANKIQVVIDNNLSSEQKPVAPDRIVLHPEYRVTAQGVPENDLALLHFTEPVSGIAIPIATEQLEAIALRPGDRVGIAGWGTATFSAESPISTRLLLGIVPVVDRNGCNQAYDGVVTDRMFCAGIGVTDSCQGDSGGPAFVHNEQGDPRLIGIVSWGAGCTKRRYPGVYVNVVKYRGWIDATIGRQQAAQ